MKNILLLLTLSLTITMAQSAVNTQKIQKGTIKKLMTQHKDAQIIKNIYNLSFRVGRTSRTYSESRISRENRTVRVARASRESRKERVARTIPYISHKKIVLAHLK